jgi:translation elongation factor Ts (EF-Ts)
VISRQDLSAEEIAHEREIQTNKVINEGKPAHVAEKIVEGRMEKFYEDVCLLDQPFIKDPSMKVKDVLAQLIAKIGENIVIRRFTRYEVGEGLEKKEENFAEEVAKQMKM